MKKILFIALAAILAVSSLASCSRRGQYEDQLESQKEAESLDAIPETNDNVTGDNAPEYQTPIILKTGDTASCQVKCNTFWRQNQEEKDNPNIYEDES